MTTSALPRLALCCGAVALAACDTAMDVDDDPAPFRLEVAHPLPLDEGDFPTDFAFTEDGSLWVTAFEGRVLRLAENGVVTTWSTSALLGAARATDLFVDDRGRPWIAGAGRIAVFEDGAWLDRSPEDAMGLAGEPAQVAVNPDGDVLLATGHVDAGGVLLRRDGVWTSFTPADSPLPSPIVHDVAVAPDGSFWLASAAFQGRGGVVRIGGGAVTHVYTAAESGLLYDDIEELSIGGGRVWLAYPIRIRDELGPDGGLQGLELEGGGVTSWFPFSTGVSSNRVTSLTWSSAGELWFTTVLDHADPGCESCFSGVGVLDSEGVLRAASHLNGAPIQPNAFLPAIRESPTGEIHVADADGRRILRVVR